MTWMQAYAQAVYPYIWFYAAALTVAGAIFLPLSALRKHFFFVVLLLIGHQVLDTLIARYLPNYSQDHIAPVWVVIGHFVFFMGMAHYTFLALRGYFDHFRGDAQRRKHSTLLRWIAYGTVMIAAATVYLEVTEGNIHFGIGIASIAAVVGFALQETLANLFAGLTLEADPPFRVGDWIHGEGFTGEVIDITWRATRLRTFENDTLIIPNRNLANAQIVNWSSPHPGHGVHLRIGTSYSDAPGRVKASLHTALRDCAGICEKPAPEIYTEDYGDFAITHDILFFITEYRDLLRIKDCFMARVWYQFRRDGIRIPFPIREVNLHTIHPRERRAEFEQELERKRELLRALPLFSSLPPEQIDYLAGEGHFHRYLHDETIIHQGDIPDFLSILVEGRARVLLRTGDIAARDRNLQVHRQEPDGHTHTDIQRPKGSSASAAAAAQPPVKIEVADGYAEVSQLNPGDFFGEISVLLGKEASATVRSAGEVLLLVIDRAAFARVLDQHPDFQEQICNLISQRVSLLHHVTKLARDKQDEIAEEPRTLIQHLRKFLRLSGADRAGR